MIPWLEPPNIELMTAGMESLENHRKLLIEVFRGSCNDLEQALNEELSKRMQPGNAAV